MLEGAWVWGVPRVSESGAVGLGHFWVSSNGSKCFQTETCLFCAAACLEPYDIVLAVCWMVAGAGIARESGCVGPHKHVEAHSQRQDMAVITALLAVTRARISSIWRMRWC